MARPSTALWHVIIQSWGPGSTSTLSTIIIIIIIISIGCSRSRSGSCCGCENVWMSRISYVRLRRTFATTAFYVYGTAAQIRWMAEWRRKRNSFMVDAKSSGLWLSLSDRLHLSVVVLCSPCFFHISSLFGVGKLAGFTRKKLSRKLRALSI